ncbi:MAG: hypothetical protein ABI675_16090 [Chitinophagaceae bacterium]
MNRFLCCLFLLGLNVAAFSQKQYFVYLQMETQQPFFVKFNEKVYSSDASGYLILSKLKDSSYTLTIGFPQNKWPEQQFSVSIKSKDHGFLLKNFGDKGWGLFDLQTLVILMADDLTKDKALRSGSGEISAFTEILSRAANDPSLREKPVALVKYDEKPVLVQAAVIKEEVMTPAEQPPVNTVLVEQPLKKKDSSLSVKKESVKKEDTTKIAQQQKTAEQPLAKNTDEIKKKTDSSATAGQSDKKEEISVAYKNPEKNKIADRPADAVAQYKRSLITKKSETSTSEGLGFIFIDEMAAGIRDTVQIIIPNQTKLISKINNSDQPAEPKKFLNVTTDEKDLSAIGANKKTCSSVASENDFLKLRKKMASQKTDEQMINECKKIFRSKCFTTEQVKNLGNLFLNEAGKFQFYETAYPFNSDQINFASLQTELKDAYFIHRFKKMVN